MKSIFEQNGGTYTKVGDYYIPNIVVPERNNYTIGKYGQLRRKFLKEHHKPYYSYLLITGKISEHLEEIDKTCHSCLQEMIIKMAEQEGITEELKATDQMAWVQKMNNIRNRAEEIVLSEYVYGGFEY